MGDQEFRRLCGTGFPPEPGETLVHQGDANLYLRRKQVDGRLLWHRIGIGGRLFLTSSRLLFHAHRFNVQSGVWTWPVGAIASVEPVNTLAMIPNGLAVVLHDGERFRFDVYKRRAWMESIERALSTARLRRSPGREVR